MGDLARKDQAQSIQPARQGQTGIPAGYARNEAGQLVPIQGGAIQPTPNPVETRRVEHVFIPPPGGMGALGMPQAGQAAPGGAVAPDGGQPQGVSVPAGQQTIIYINAAPPPPQPAQPAGPPPTQPRIIHHHATNEDRPRRRTAPPKGMSFLGLVGLLLGAASIYLYFKPGYNLNPLYVAIAGLAASAVGLLGAIGGGRSRAGLPFLAMLVCGALVAMGYGWDKPAIEEINKQLKKHNIDITVPDIPKSGEASSGRSPATVPATQTTAGSRPIQRP